MKFNAKLPRTKPRPGAAYILFSVKDAHGNRVEVEGLYPDSTIAEVWNVIKGKVLLQDAQSGEEKAP
jgi:hypothetical protein